MKILTNLWFGHRATQPKNSTYLICTFSEAVDIITAEHLPILSFFRSEIGETLSDLFCSTVQPFVPCHFSL